MATSRCLCPNVPPGDPCRLGAKSQLGKTQYFWVTISSPRRPPSVAVDVYSGTVSGPTGVLIGRASIAEPLRVDSTMIADTHIWARNVSGANVGVVAAIRP